MTVSSREVAVAEGGFALSVTTHCRREANSTALARDVVCIVLLNVHA